MISGWYSVAMILSAVSAPLFGLMLDRVGIVTLAIAIAISATATPLAFLGRGWVADFGIAVWGIGTVVQDSMLVAIVAKVTPERGTRRRLAISTRSTAWRGWLAA